MQITKGKIPGALKVVVYGPEGIGKSTFAAQFPEALFIDTEGSTKELDVARFADPSSWTMLLEEVKHVKANPGICKTLIIDTADWAEILCAQHVCSNKLPPKNKGEITGIEDFNYGKGYTYLEEEYGRLLNLLNEIIEIGIHVVFTAHAQMRKFEQPDEMGAYDRWEMKLEKKTSPLLKEWADMVLFANYKTYVVNVDGQGTQKGKNKAQGGSRVMYTSHHPCWDAKNRHSLPEELPFDYKSISHIIERNISTNNSSATVIQTQVPPPPAQVAPPPVQAALPVEKPQQQQAQAQRLPLKAYSSDNFNLYKAGIPKALADLMTENMVTIEEIQEVVAERGYYPKDTPIQNYDPEFINGVLVAAWPQVYEKINEKLPI